MEKKYGQKVKVDFCMRYGNPSTQSKVREMVQRRLLQKFYFFPFILIMRELRPQQLMINFLER